MFRQISCNILTILVSEPFSSERKRICRLVFSDLSLWCYVPSILLVTSTWYLGSFL